MKFFWFGACLYMAGRMLEYSLDRNILPELQPAAAVMFAVAISVWLYAAYCALRS